MARLRQLQRPLFLSLLSTTLVASTTLNMLRTKCPNKSGNITVPYLFGTQHGCYRDDAFQITCNESNTPPKAIIGSRPTSNIELTDINNITGEARATTDISYVCYNSSDNIYNYQETWMNLTNHPTFLFKFHSDHSSCSNISNDRGYLCQCKPGYEGNPYLPSGCIDTDECNSPDKNPCSGICENTDGSFICSCKGFFTRGKPQLGKDASCNTDTARVVICAVVGVGVLLGLCFLVATRLQHKRHMKEKEEYQKYCHMMDHYLRVFSRKQIEIATSNFDEANVLGGGGQGKVYKGLLENNQVVAIKKAREVEEAQRGEFVNEIILSSQINHKNIVKLLGCCLEVKIPMLVYEFVPNGTLFELLHGKSKNRPITLTTRLRIALESAEALDYLHSSICRFIIHGDVKSANILLEDDYHAKVSDFGTSNLVPIEDTKVVKVVQGTRGYLDPEYVATAVLTKKSDVYSFGVVLLELITRKCAIFRDETSERKHLASCFVSNASKNKLHELLDKEIVTNNEKVIEVLHEVSNLAIWCLNVRGEDRPTMRQVVEKLKQLGRFHSSLMGQEILPEEAESLLGESMSYFTSDASAIHSTVYFSVLETETRVTR